MSTNTVRAKASLGSSLGARYAPSLASRTIGQTPTQRLVFSGTNVLVTGVGGDGQVGEVVASAFANLGASLVLVDRTLDKAQARAAAISDAGHSARAYACDLTSA